MIRTIFWITINMVAVVVPTIRPSSFLEFMDAWAELFEKHNVELVYIRDGDDPVLVHNDFELKLSDVPELKDLIFNRNDGIRNFGFYYVAKYLKNVEYVLTLDDDTKPYEDTISDHLQTLSLKVPVSWLSTATAYMRGFPYGIRDEAEVVLSHGLWHGVADWDAPTQLVVGNPQVDYYEGPIPKGIYYPMCGMNVAFKRKMLPYMYYAPMGYKVDMDRFADIWLGVVSKRIIDENGWAVVSGYAYVRHERASNVWVNLKKEVRGLELNEGFWKGEEKDPYFDLYREKRTAWEKLIKEALQ